MSSELTFAGRTSSGSDEVDALLYLSDTHQVLVWTMAFPERREVVGLEVAPRDGRGRTDLTLEWVMPRLEEWRKTPPPNPQPLPSSLLRQEISFRQVMSDRAEAIAQADAVEGEYGEHAIGVSSQGAALGAITGEEMTSVESLIDALLYVDAVQTGASPVAAIADYRTISRRTAEGRIVRSRQRGLLTPAKGKRAGGDLTPYAHDLMRRLDAVGAGLEKLRSDGNG